jgi:hypothetical protein
MQKNSSQILDHFYSLLMEINFLRPEADVFGESGYKEDAFIQKHLRQIKLKMAKVKAEQTKGGFKAILEEVKRLKAMGSMEINKLLNPEQQLQLQPLFRKFEEFSEKDEASMANDAELLQIISALRDSLDQTDKTEDHE